MWCVESFDENIHVIYQFFVFGKASMLFFLLFKQLFNKRTLNTWNIYLHYKYTVNTAGKQCL